jgi:hypothetical protein
MPDRKNPEYGQRNTDKVFSCEIQTTVDVPGMQYEVVINYNRNAPFDADRLAREGIGGFVDFSRRKHENAVCLDGYYTPEELLALFLALNEDF